MSSKRTTDDTDSQISTLLETIERLRRDQFTHLDTTLVRDILRLHVEGKTADAEILRSVEQAVERHLSGGG